MRTLVLFLFLTGTIFADSSEPPKFKFSENHENYYVVAVLDPKDNKQLTGFQIFDSKNHLVQFINDEEDLSNKIPDYIAGKIPDAQPVQFADCNFDGYADIMLREDLSPRFQSFEIWIWNPKQKKFIFDKDLNDAEINRIDPKEKRLYSGGSGGHGSFCFSEYAYSPSGKLTLLSIDRIEYSKDLEVKTYYSNGRIVKTVTSVPEPLK